MGIISELLVESGRKAEDAQKRYKKFQGDHPHLVQLESLGTSLLDPSRSTYKEFEELMEPGVEGLENLAYALDSENDENNLDNLEEDQYYDR